MNNNDNTDGRFTVGAEKLCIEFKGDWQNGSGNTSSKKWWTIKVECALLIDFTTGELFK